MIKSIFSGGAMILTIMDEPQRKKLGHPGEPQRFGQKLEIKYKKNLYTRQAENPKGRLGQKGYPGGQKTRKGGPGKS